MGEGFGNFYNPSSFSLCEFAKKKPPPSFPVLPTEIPPFFLDDKSILLTKKKTGDSRLSTRLIPTAIKGIKTKNNPFVLLSKYNTTNISGIFFFFFFHFEK